MRILCFALPFLALGACATTGSPGSEVPVAGGSGYACRSDMLPQFVGSVATQQLGSDILTASGSRTLRWVPKGGAVTMDYRQDRVTVALDGSNKVERASCG